MANIQTLSVQMTDGHLVNVFVNKDTNLIVVDYIHKNDNGGTELLRRFLDPAQDLAHCEDKPKKRTNRKVGA